MFTSKPVLLVTLSWPADPDRGTETYGPFKNASAQERFVDDGIDSVALTGTHYELHRAFAPFDPRKLDPMITADASGQTFQQPGLAIRLLQRLAGTDWCIDHAARGGWRGRIANAVYGVDGV